MTRRILIVDDEEDIRDVVQASLEEFAGWSTATAASGLEGLAIAQTEAETLTAILIDISMPDMDGFQLCNVLKTNTKTQSIPIIVLTAKVLPSDRQCFEALDIVGVITKPFDPINIWKQIENLLDRNI